MRWGAGANSEWATNMKVCWLGCGIMEEGKKGSIKMVKSGGAGGIEIKI